MVALSAIVVLKQGEAKEEKQPPKNMWANWRHKGIIGVV